jgi:hypothetical protein
VHSAFVVRLDSGEWETIWSAHEAEDATRQRSDAETRITNDPQVKSALEAVKALGLANSEQFEQAIRFGAATMAAPRCGASGRAVRSDR